MQERRQWGNSEKAQGNSGDKGQKGKDTSEETGYDWDVGGSSGGDYMDEDGWGSS